MKLLIIVLAIVFSTGASLAGEREAETLSLEDAVSIALRNNPGVSAARKGMEAEEYGVLAARSERLPDLSLNGGASRYRYPQPVTPISGSPLTTGFPDFDETIYDIAVSFRLPLYKGGRIERGIAIAEARRAAAEDLLKHGRAELVYNVTAVYYKVLQLEGLLESSRAHEDDLGEHKKIVELSVKAGTVPRVDLLKTELELAHARQNTIQVRNNIAVSYELLKTLLGIDMEKEIRVKGVEEKGLSYPAIDSSLKYALEERADYRAALKKRGIADERVKSEEGRRLPEVSLNGEYGDRAGEDFGFKENWAVGVRFTLPIFDGGLIKADIGRQRKEAERAALEEKALRSEIIRQVKEAYASLEDSGERLKTAEAAIGAASENLRIERLKYSAGEGTSVDVLDAETALLRARTDYHQAYFDRLIAAAALKRAVGEEGYEKAE